MKSLSIHKASKHRRPRGVGRVNLTSASNFFELPTSRHVPGVWEAGARSLKPKGAFWTDAELLTLGANTDVKYELRDGKIIPMSPAGPKHGAVIARLTHYLTNHI